MPILKTIGKALFFVQPMRLLSYFIPKKKNRWVFLPRHYQARYEGNIKALINHLVVSSNDLELVCVNLPKNPNAYKFDIDPKVTVVRGLLNLRALLHILRAEVVITDAQLGFLKGNFRLAQLWHGTGFKNIQALNAHQQRSVSPAKELIFVLATSESDQVRKQRSFLTEKVFVTGSPRNDIFFADRAARAFELKSELGLASYGSVITYAPTFRSHKGTTAFSDWFWPEIQRTLEKTNSVFVVKKHPNDSQLNVPTGFKNIVDLSERTRDVQELLLITDVLVSDYSGIVTDFALLDRPIVFYIFDYEEYIKKSRDFYYDLKTTLPGPFIESEGDLVHKLGDLSWAKERGYQSRYQNFVKTFQAYKDGGSSERVVVKIKELLRYG